MKIQKKKLVFAIIVAVVIALILVILILAYEGVFKDFRLKNVVKDTKYSVTVCSSNECQAAEFKINKLLSWDNKIVNIDAMFMYSDESIVYKCSTSDEAWYLTSIGFADYHRGRYAVRKGRNDNLNEKICDIVKER